LQADRCNAGLIAVAIMLAVGVCDGCGEEADSAAHRESLLAGCVTVCGVLAGMWHLLLCVRLAERSPDGPGPRYRAGTLVFSTLGHRGAQRGERGHGGGRGGRGLRLAGGPLV